MALYVDGVKVTTGEVHYGDRVAIDLNSSRTALDITQRGSGKYLSMHGGTEPTWGHSPLLAVGGVVEFDGRAYLDDVLSVAGSVALHDGSEPTWGHSPRFGVEGVAEFDGAVYLDAIAYFASQDMHNAGIRVVADQAVNLGNSEAFLEHSADDANAKDLRLVVYEGDGTNVPVFSFLPYASRSTDLGLFDGLTQSLLAVPDKSGRIATSTTAQHTGSALARLIKSATFGSAVAGDLVRITAGTCVTTGWYWVDDTPAASAVVLDHNFVAATTGSAANVAFVLYHNFPMLSAEGVKLKVFDGAPSDADVEIDADGWLGLDAKSGSGRLYWRAQNAWHYVSATAGFEVPAKEKECPVCGKEIGLGEAVTGIIDDLFADGARHGRWAHLACATKRRK